MVSVIVPVYNCEKYIEKCIKSILRQTYNDLEIIIIDDGSEDDSFHICKKIADNDKRLKIIHQKNQGVSFARNQGLNIAKGEFIIFIDGDDWVEETYIEKLVFNLQKEKADMSICGWYRENIYGEINDSLKYYYRILDKKEAIHCSLMPDGFQGYLWNKLFKRDILKKYELIFDSNITIFEDLLFVTKYLTHCDKIVVDYLPLYHYVNHDDSARQNSMLNKKFNRKWLTEIEAMTQIVNIIDDKNLKKFAKSKKALSCGFYLKRMYECNYSDDQLKQNLMRYIRKNLPYILKYKAGNNLWRITTIICSFSPKLEMFVHNIIVKLKMKMHVIF